MSAFDQRWIQHQRKNHKSTKTYACIHCLDRHVFTNPDDLWKHARDNHQAELPTDESEQRRYRTKFELQCIQNPSSTETPQPQKTTFKDSNTEAEPPPQKRPYPSPVADQSLPGDLKELNIATPRSTDVLAGDDSSEGCQTPDQPRKRVAVESAGSASPFRDSESPSSPGPTTKARPTSAPGPYSPKAENQSQMTFEASRPHVGNKQLWSPQDAPSPVPRSSLDVSNIASVQAQRSRAQVLQPKNRKSFPSSPQATTSRILPNRQLQNTAPPTIFGKSSSAQNSQVTSSKEEGFDIMLQPETRPISQEQLVAEVKGIYAGLVMVEAKCIEVDNKQAALAHADGGNPPKLNNEQWQALIALHRTLLHEHHDFFLASQHPSASPALRRLASKYAMPARMWRHGIHSFLELLRHRLPASLDHMLAFIYLAYSMMALLYETVPAFEDTWIECLGDLGRYRMAIEDDDIRDREVWTGVARHWYSKASDKAPTTGRLYHHLAILARPNALQQLFYYSKSLCVAVPFTSARESILTLFEPVFNADNGQGQYRLPPLDTAFVKAHGLLFTKKEIHKFDHTVDEFLALLNTQIGRVTRKFMEQGYYIAVANSVAMLGFASPENLLMKVISSQADREDVSMEESFDATSEPMVSFKHAQHLSNASTKIVLDRVGDPNVLPFIHITLIFMLFMAHHAGAMAFLQADFPWTELAIMLNTLLGSYENSDRIMSETFPLPEKDDPRPFPEDFAVRGLLWAENYFPFDWFTKKKIDEEEKYHERPSMTAQRKERILWLACRICALGPWLSFDGTKFSSLENNEPQASRASTFASATTQSLDRAETWESQDYDLSDAEEDMSSPPTVHAVETAQND
ncbi:hypothetical protein G7Y89_g6064 [Cudoniella acicularis]|uniref:Nonsense-mediated mRNA decay factor n=1 Tax=Cudoniella acicularis TaxID=354080 RepID=A0A8H4RNF8_9HELO|nr:hypothetical protein G7Y89_g6064 [Cudoniella acicularis]